METAELQLTQTSAFSTKESFEHVQRVATMFSKSDMIPKRYINNIGNCIIAIEMATRMNANILMVMQNLDAVSYTHLRAHETPEHLVCRLLLEKKKTINQYKY